MKRFAAILTVTLTILALPGCVQDKPAPRLDSSNSNERIEAVRQAEAEIKPSQPLPVPAQLQVLAAQTVTSQAIPSLGSAATQLFTVKRFQDESARGDTQDKQTLAITPLRPNPGRAAGDGRTQK